MEVGDRFGGYRLDAQLGRGGMGVVYEAYDTVRERRVALKVLVPHLADDETFRARFLREARTVAGLSSPHTVPVHDFGELDGHLFLDMALVDGSDLAVLLARGPLSPVRAVGIAEQVADALDTAHDRGLVHRDVKPANVLLARRRPDQPDFAYLSDFGLARSTSGDDGLTATGTVVGTADYMSPEQIEGRPVDARSDVYALGCLLFHCLAGRPPYTGSNQVLVLDAHRTAAPPLLPAGGTWGDLDAVVARALAKDPAHRFASAGALASAARAALVSAAATGSAPTAISPRTDPTPTTDRRTPAPPSEQAPAPAAAWQDEPPPPSWQQQVPPAEAPGLELLEHRMAQASPTGTIGPPRRSGLSRRAVVGIALGSVALVVVLGGAAALALGIALSGGSSTTNGTSTGTTAGDSGQSSDGRASGEARGRGGPADPALGATPAGEVLPEDAALMLQLPADLTGCRSAALDEYGGETSVAAVACLARSLPGAQVNALSYPDEASRDAAFAAYSGPDAEGDVRCPEVGGVGPWSSPDGAGGGRALCYLVADPASEDGAEYAVMTWSVTGRPFFLVVHDADGTDPAPLYDWQQQHAAHYGTATTPSS